MNFRTFAAACAAFAVTGMIPGASAQMQPSVSKQIFLDAELNHDGFVDLDEFHKDIVIAFHALDHNRDGYVTADEILSLPDKPRAELAVQMMKAADKDGDGRLSFGEVVEARMAYFDQADNDGDERLGLAEVMAYDFKGVQRARMAAAAALKKK
jgi:hypothetical protein